MATLKVQYECPVTGQNTEANCDPCMDVNGKTFYVVEECPVCGEEHYIDV